MVSFLLWICSAVLISVGISAPHQGDLREPHPASNTFHEADSLEDELPGRSGLHPVLPQILKSEADHDVSQIQNTHIDVKDVLLRFFKKLKNHPEILQQLIESEEKRLLQRYEDMLELEDAESNPDSIPGSISPVENSIPIPYQSEKMVVKKGGSSQMDYIPEYDPRSAPELSGPLSGSDLNNNSPSDPANLQENDQPSDKVIVKLKSLQKQQDQTSPFINSLPLFDKLPNPHSKDKMTTSETKTIASLSTVKQPKKISQASFDSNIEEIKHVPIREELASEVPPSLLADKKELREEAHQALKKAEAEALKTKQFQAALQKEQLKQMAKEQKAKQEKKEVGQQEEQSDQKQPQEEDNQEQAELSQDSESVQKNDPYGYYYYYYNYPELAQQVFNDDSEELSNESYLSEDDSTVSGSVGSSKPHDSSESSISQDSNSEQNGSNDSIETRETSNSNESEDENHISSEEVTVDDDNEDSDQENELKALLKRK